jgi:uncharacterized membrane protein
MELDDFFGQGRNPQRQGYDPQYRRDEDEDQPSRSFYQQNDMKEQLLNKLRSNPKLKMLLIIAAILIIVVVTSIVILLFPLLLKLFNYITENGIQGILDTIWKGTK